MNSIVRLDQYPPLLAALRDLKQPEQVAKLRNLCKSDLFFLLRYGCNRADMEHPWLLERCREVQASPDGHLDLWSREHYKSTIITFGLTLQNILNDPEITIGIFSHTRPIAKGFLRQIKRELEANERLKLWFNDILFENPQKESPKWSEDDGLVIKRQSNPKESTVEGWGLVDGQPTGKHYRVRVYDDIVTSCSVGSPEMIAKTTEAMELSDNLGTVGGAVRFIGTRYHYHDAYSDIMTRKIAKPRIYPCTLDGTDNFAPENCTLMPAHVLTEKRKVQGLYTFSCQMLLQPKGDDAIGFRREWLRHTSGPPERRGLNIYILVDPANSKRKRSDYTAMWVCGLGPDNNVVILDVLRDKLNLTERAEALFALVKQWQPIQQVVYEEYGLQADIAHIEGLQHRMNYRFRILPVGGTTSKEDRIRRLLPWFEAGRIYLPPSRYRTLYDKSTVNLIDDFVEQEYLAFPVAQHDDMLDCLARIADPALHLKWPVVAVNRFTAGAYGGQDQRPSSYLSHQSAGDRLRARSKQGRSGLTHVRPNR